MVHLDYGADCGGGRHAGVPSSWAFIGLSPANIHSSHCERVCDDSRGTYHISALWLLAWFGINTGKANHIEWHLTRNASTQMDHSGSLCTLLLYFCSLLCSHLPLPQRPYFPNSACPCLSRTCCFVCSMGHTNAGHIGEIVDEDSKPVRRLAQQCLL